MIPSAGARKTSSSRGLEEVVGLSLDEIAVIDDAESVPQRHSYGAVGACVARQPSAAFVRLLGGRGHFRLRIGATPAEAAAHEVIAGDVDLDCVDAFADHRAHGAAHLVHAVGDDLDALVVHVELANVAEPACRGDLGRRRAHARAWNSACVDRVADHGLEPELRRRRGVDAGEARIEHELHVLHRRQHVLLDRDLAELLELHEVGVGDVGMGLDHARHERVTATVDDFCVAAIERARRAHGANAVAFDEHVGGDGWRPFAVEHDDVGE